jgi:hypothetical protein
MDADGEDPPEDIPKLMDRFDQWQGSRAIFAKRKRRTEGFLFSFFYSFYKLIHLLLTGRKISVGNYSIISRNVLDQLVGVSEMWNHYAASVLKARIPFDSVPIDRSYRIAGRSKMNFTSLTIHGLSAIAVYADSIGVRLLLAIFFCIMFLLGCLGAVIAVKLATDLAIPGWATVSFGILSLLLSQAITIVLMFVIITLHGRAGASFLPIRDYEHFVLGVYEVHPDV